MVQDLLAKMLANITASQCLLVRMSPARGRRQDDGCACIACQGLHYRQMSRDCRVGRAKLLGGNGIVADYNVGRFFVDAEASLLLRGHVPNAKPDSR